MGAVIFQAHILISRYVWLVNGEALSMIDIL